MDITIKIATSADADEISRCDRWIDILTLNDKIERREVYVAYNGDRFAGWLRYNLFWDNTPFMTMLHLLPEYRGIGIGSRMVAFWESEMKKAGYTVLLTSTAQTEFAQHFYIKLGYTAIGGFTLDGEPLELIFTKRLN